MKRRKLITLLVIAAVLVAASWVEWFRAPSEPVYKGKAVSTWLVLLYESRTVPNSQVYNPPTKLEVEAAVREIGTNALPVLLRMARASEDSSLKKVLLLISRRIAIDTRLRFGLWSYDEKRGIASEGLRFLGAQAKPAVPELVHWLDGKDIDLRRSAAQYLIDLGPAAADAVPSLISHLRDPDPDVRGYALTALGFIHSHPDLVLPVFKDILADSKRASFDKSFVLHVLPSFGAEARGIAPSIALCLTDTNARTASEATNALMQIAPDGATNGWANYKKP